MPSRDVKPDKFAGEIERAVWTEYLATKDEVSAAIEQRRYADVFDILARIQPAVNAYFDKGGVMVMDPDESLRDNRLSTLSHLIERFAEIADFRVLGAQS